ncbi:hypothetical protein BMS3Bbin03_01835 [bacterium BMS3Bbin03]|nr:hypothetical protein BMS3Bbin03_01835 [bacterium BMS3Bbin03]
MVYTMKIKSVARGSIGDEIGLRPGDNLLEINGHPIRDVIDYRFYENDEFLQLLVQRDGEIITYAVEKDPYDSTGLEFSELKFKACGNKCVFCFTDQNPKGMRKSLYFKDEDYRLSFLYGNYTTLTNVKQSDLDRIVEQRLSPFYVSVHATDWEIRKFLLGIKRNDFLLDKLQFLTEHGIEIHAQIVLCPGINDGEIFGRTIADLKRFYPGIRSTAVVPLGLTAHRQGLTPLTPVTGAYARPLVFNIYELQQQFLEELGTRFLFVSDEFLVRAGVPIPEAGAYEDYPQLEDGVGVLRSMIENVRALARKLPKSLRKARQVTIVSGELAHPFVEEEVVKRLNRIQHLTAELLPVKNKFYGETVTVMGLLTGRDIFTALQKQGGGGEILLSEKLLNHDGVFLDDWKPKMIEKRLNRKIYFVDDYFRNLPEILRKLDS